jgi:hypothetical protein
MDAKKKDRPRGGTWPAERVSATHYRYRGQDIRRVEREGRQMWQVNGTAHPLPTLQEAKAFVDSFTK